MGLFDETPIFKTAFADPKDHDTHKELVNKMQQGDLSAYKQLRRMYQPMIHRMAIDYQPSSGDVSLAQIKMRAEYELPKLLMKYDPQFGANVTTYVKGSLGNHMENLVREHLTGPYVSRSHQTMGNRYRQALREAEKEYGQNPSDEQIMIHLPEVNTLEEFNKYKRYSHESYIGDVRVGNGDDNTFLFRDQFTLGDEKDDQSEKFHSMALERIDQVMKDRLSPRDYAIVKSRVIDGDPMAQVAITYGISTTKLRSILDVWNKIKTEEGLV